MFSSHIPTSIQTFTLYSVIHIGLKKIKPTVPISKAINTLKAVDKEINICKNYFYFVEHLLC